MQNVDIKRQGNKLTIVINLAEEDFGLSSSAKTWINAATRGNAAVPGTTDTFLGLTMFTYLNAAEKAAVQDAQKAGIKDLAELEAVARSVKKDAAKKA